MPRRFRALIAALLVLAPAQLRAQTPDAPTLVQRMRERAIANVAGVRSFTVAYTAGPSRTLGYAERSPKGAWLTMLEPSDDQGPAHGLAEMALDLVQLAGTEPGDPDEMVPAGTVRSDTLDGRRVYAVQIAPRGGMDDDGTRSLLAMVDAETYDLVRVVITGMGSRGGKDVGGEPVVIQLDLLDWREQMRVRLPSRYRVRGWNMEPRMTAEEIAALDREITAQRDAFPAESAEWWRTNIMLQMLRTGQVDIPFSVAVVSVDQPAPPEFKIRLEDEGN